MNIVYITFTGADDKTEPFELDSLSKRNRNIEWAILISDKNAGTSRYPTKKWREHFYATSPDSQKAAHLCGKDTLTKFVERDADLVEELKHYHRVQLNFNAIHLDASLLDKLVCTVNSRAYLRQDGLPIEFIIQYNKANKECVTRFNTINILFDNTTSQSGVCFTVSPALLNNDDNSQFDADWFEVVEVKKSGEKLITKTEREEAFKRDLQEILLKHNAELKVTDDGNTHGLHSGICLITMMPKFDNNGNQTHEYTEFSI